MISVSKKGNYGYFYRVHESLEDFFYFVLHEKTPVVDSRCTFLSGWTYDIHVKAGILNIHC